MKKRSILSVILYLAVLALLFSWIFGLFGGGGSDFAAKQPANSELPFGGGVGGGVKVIPIAFMVIKGDSVRMMPVASAPNTTADRVVELMPDVLDKISAFLDKRIPTPAE